MGDGGLAPGTVVGGRWRITDELGRGGFGRVFRASDTSAVGLGEAALKVLHAGTSPQERDEFLREVQQIARLRHQNLVGYLDSGLMTVATPAGGEVRPYVVTELCHGSLKDYLAEAPGGVLTVTETLDVLRDVCTGLAHLHERRLIHRDIKPANLLFAEGTWKLGDFGLMRDLSMSGAYRAGDLVAGTPRYMAPELFTTGVATAQSDVYAIGVTAHVCLTGRAVHSGVDAAFAYLVATQEPQIDPGLDPSVAQLVVAATAREAAARPTARQLLDRMTELSRGSASAGALASPAPPAARPTGAPVGPPAPWPVTATPRPAPPAGDAAAFGHAASPGHAGPPGPPGPPAAAEPRRPRRSGTTTILAIAVPSAVVLVGLVVAAVLGVRSLLDGWDDLVRTAGGEVVDEQPAAGGDVDQAQSPTGIPTLAPGEAAPDAGSPTPAVGDPASGEVPDPESHLVAPLCPDGSPGGVVSVVNQHSVPVDYSVQVDHYGSLDLRLDQTYESVRALPPGGEALLDVTATEDTATRCEVVEFAVVESDPDAVAAVESAQLTSCELDDFLEDWYEIVFTVDNTTGERVDAEVGFAVVDAGGRRLDEGSTTTVFGIDPGTSAQGESSEVFWTLGNTDAEVAECIVTWVELTPALM